MLTEVLEIIKSELIQKSFIQWNEGAIANKFYGTPLH